VRFQVYASGVIFRNLARPAGLQFRHRFRRPNHSGYSSHLTPWIADQIHGWKILIDSFERKPSGWALEFIHQLVAEMNEAQNELLRQHNEKN
jgi:hypothetical protein